MNANLRRRHGGDAGRVAFVRFAPWAGFENSHPHDLMWPVTLLSAATRARRLGWSTEIIDLHVTPATSADIVRRLQTHRTDVLLVDTMTPTMALARRFAAEARAAMPDLAIWGVGQHASEQPEDLLYEETPLDGCLRGEYDGGLPDLLAVRGREPVDGSAVYDSKRGEVVSLGARWEVHDLDALPPVEPLGVPLGRYQMRSVHVPSFRRQRWGYLMTSRGCPYRCTFCSPTLRQSYGPKFRAHSAERVVDDLARIHRDYGVTSYYMIDDIFSFDRERVLEICERLAKKELPIRFAVQTRPDFLDRGMVRALKRAGCCGVKVGIESGVDRVLKEIKKGARSDALLRGVREVRAAGLFLTAYFMVGNPTETRDEIEQTFQFARRVDADMIQVAFHTPYPGSETYRRHRESVRDASDLSHYNSATVNLSNVEHDELVRLQRNFYLRYYLSPRVLFNHLRRRTLYRLFDASEWTLVASALRYLLLVPRRTGASAMAPPPHVPQGGRREQPLVALKTTRAVNADHR